VPYLEATSDGRLKLAEEHAYGYFYQIQLQMLCTNTKFADFFVWSPRVDDGVYHLERVRRNATVCETIIRGSLKFFFESVIPELFGRYYSNKNSENKENAVVNNV